MAPAMETSNIATRTVSVTARPSKRYPTRTQSTLSRTLTHLMRTARSSLDNLGSCRFPPTTLTSFP